MTLTKISILEYALREGGGGHSKAYSMYAFINVDNCERPLRPLLKFDFRGEENFAGVNFRGRKISRNSIRSGYYFRGRKISRKIQIREYSENFLHAKNLCYTVVADYPLGAPSLLLTKINSLGGRIVFMVLELIA